MKLFVSLALLAVSAVPSFACTNIIVGKNASKDGSVICTYNCDGYGFAGSLTYTPPSRHEAGEMIPVRDWGVGPVTGYIPQVEYTYGVMGYINENQVSIVETTFAGRPELVNREGYLDYDSMMQFGLQRSRTAREAIKVMTDLVAEYGYNSSGETITVCDKDEAWIMEIIGKGPGRKGAVWVALRVPDDCICCHANLSRIRRFPLAGKIDRKLGCYVSDNGNCMYSADVISFAREKGFFNGRDEDFSFRDAYCPIDFENVRYADARVWSFFRHHWGSDSCVGGNVASDAMFPLIDSYLPYINGDFGTCDHLPLWIRPAEKLDVRDVMADMRDHYEGTPLDMTADISAGPWGMPVRPMPMQFKSGGKTYFTERPIATQKSGFTLVSQLRSWLPNPVGGIMYFNCDDANMIAYVPVYCCNNLVPDAFDPRIAEYTRFNMDCAFWRCNLVSNMVYPRYSVMIGDLREAQQELEDYYASEVAANDSLVADMTRIDMVNILTRKSCEYTVKMMDRWDILFKFLAVRYNDQIAMPVRDGKVISRRYGVKHPGYDQEFYDKIAEDTGDRYLMREAISRAER